ncbi:MAG: hypothetical protein ACLUTU_02780 [Blautia faecis]
MAVEEIVKENTPKAEGEAQGVKYISLTEEELERLIKAAGREGAKKGVEAYERRKEKDKEELADKVKNSSKTIIIHYRQLKKMKNTSVTGTDTVTDPTLKEILDGILEQVRKEEFNLTSTNKNRIVTGMLLNHVDVQLENYKKECRKSKIQDIQRRYRVVERMFLQAEPVRAEDVAEEEQIDKSTVYRTLEKAYDDLAVLFFGIEGVKSIEVNRKPKKSGKKTMRNADTRKLENAKKGALDKRRAKWYSDKSPISYVSPLKKGIVFLL